MPPSISQARLHPINSRPNHKNRPVLVPSAKLEYAYYFAVVYSILGPAVGFEIPALGGGLILIVWLLCIRQLKKRMREVFAPISLLIACGLSFILIQVGVYGESLMDTDIRAFVTWMMGLMIVQSLLLRPGFSIRFPMLLFFIGLVTLPFLIFNPAGNVEMARADIAVQGALTHPAGFANWFGFCAIFFAVLGSESKQAIFKIAAWGMMIACLLLVAMSVERGPLFGTLLGLIVAFRRVLRRGFLPLFLLTFLVAVVSYTGVFERAASNYFERGFEDTGREILWPEAIDRIEASPLFGEGKSEAVIFLGVNKFAQPHNSFLYFALTSGIIPFLLFVAFWVRVTWKVTFPSLSQVSDSFSLSYLVFIGSSLMLGDLGFMSVSALFITSLVATASTKKRPKFAWASTSRANLARRPVYGSRPLLRR
jgi:O-antigen ligase